MSKHCKSPNKSRSRRAATLKMAAPWIHLVGQIVELVAAITRFG